VAYNHFDTETCGFYGPICLLQYRRTEDRIFRHERGSHEGIVLYEPWHNPIGRTLEEFDALINSIVIGFNLTFDWFHVAQMYTTLLELRRDRGADAYPVDHIQQYADCEVIARTGPAIKPISAVDLMLHARKGPYQSMMEREDIRVKKIPRILGKDLANALDQKLHFKDIYFARKKNRKERWVVKDITDSLGDVDPDFVDLVLSFAPSSGLKVLAQDALGYGDDISKFEDINVDPKFQPDELGYAPYARAVDTGKDWTRVIEEHLLHWRHNKDARNYAKDDIVYTHELDEHFEYPEHGDDDSILACMVGTVRWKGYRIDQTKMHRLVDANRSYQKNSIANFNSTQVCTTYLTQVLSPTELAVLTPNGKVTTGKIILEDLVKWNEEDVHEECMGAGCERCDQGTIKKRGNHKCVMCLGRGTGILGARCRICAGAGSLDGDIPHPVAYRAKEILEYRHAGKEAELLEKLVHADRFHASLNVIGALSGRMSGADGLNAQGINRGKHVRECFPLADEDMQLTGGDFSGFEVCLADAVYGDPDLRTDLMTLRPCKVCAKTYKKSPEKCTIVPIKQMDGSIKDGPIHKDCPECKGTGQESTKIHALFGQYLFPPMTYDEIYDTKGLPGEQDKYSRSKNGVFALLYGGEAYTLSTRVGVPENVANDAYQRWAGRYKVWGEARREIISNFCSMSQPNGIGTQVVWKDPADYIETMFGFKRYFTLENKVCKALFEIADDPPKEWGKLKVKVMRRDKIQTAGGAVRSALYGACFGIQAGNMRAAANHVIQGTGAGACKKLQRRIWDLQPSGVSRWIVQPVNIHDEIMTPTDPPAVKKILTIIDAFIEEMKQLVPLIAIDWGEKLNTWADK
jgi:hypothetical protein